MLGKNVKSIKFGLLALFTLILLVKIYSSAGPALPPLSSVYGNGKKPELRGGERANATFVTLVRNRDLWEMAKSIIAVEDRFNQKYGYNWVFLNDEPFDDEFITVTSLLTTGTTEYGIIPPEHWSMPDWIDQDRAAEVRESMKERHIIYGDSLPYRHMCRFESGFFFRHPLMLKYEYYWRVEPSINLYCDIDYDVFNFMKDNKKKYSFVISLYEYEETIATLWDSVKKYMYLFPQHLAANGSIPFLSDDGGETYNHCHFWSNFEIASLDWLRSQAYIDYFDLLDKDGGFFYERWGDAPVHSLAAAMTLDRNEIHFFEDIGYYHLPFHHCPIGNEHREHCVCPVSETFDWKLFSCLSKYYAFRGWERPQGWENYGDKTH